MSKERAATDPEMKSREWRPDSERAAQRDREKKAVMALEYSFFFFFLREKGGWRKKGGGKERANGKEERSVKGELI